MSAAEDYSGALELDPSLLSDEELNRLAWDRGVLRHLLRDHQLAAYDAYRAWELQPPANSNGQYARIFVLDIARRWGKTTLAVLIRIEDCIRNPGSAYRYVTAFQKDIEEIIDDVSRSLLDTCPDDLRPVYKGSQGAQSAGFYFPNGSVLKLAGLDKHPNALRGRASDGDCLSEAYFIRNLQSSVKNVLYAQYQGRDHARMILESSAPDQPETEYDKVFVADAKLRGAYFFATIDDNTHLRDEDREEFIRAAGGKDDPDCQREYYGIRTRDARRVLVPEFKPLVHVVHTERPKHFHGYVGGDPGIRDLFGLVFGYWHAPLRRLVIERSWAGGGEDAATGAVAKRVAATEAELWALKTPGNDTDALTAHRPEATYWNGAKLCGQPYLRVADTELRLIQDMWIEHRLRFQAADKGDGKDAALLNLRNGFADMQITIEPDAGPIIDHLLHGKWNERKTEWERHKHYGHFDCVAALQYLWRVVNKNANPAPPETFGRATDSVFIPAVAEQHRASKRTAIEQAFARNPRGARRR